MSTTQKKSLKKKQEVNELNESETPLQSEVSEVEVEATHSLESQNLEVSSNNTEVKTQEKNSKPNKKNFEELDSLPNTDSKTSWIWIRDTNGRPSMSATFASVAFWVTTAAYVFSMFESLGPFKFREFDVAACGAYLIPILTLYFSRRWTADVQTKKINNSGE